MGKKKRHDMTVKIENTPIIEGGYSDSADGFVVFHNMPDRNIHLTCYHKNGIFDAHIKDSTFGDVRIWECRMTDQQVNEMIRKWIDRSVKTYHGNRKYWMFTNFMSSIFDVLLKKDYKAKKVEFDLEQFVNEVRKGKKKTDFMVWTKIRDGLNPPKPGMIFSKSQSYIVCPVDKHRMVFINTNWKKNILGIMPFGQGLNQYFKYLEKEGILSKSKILSDPNRMKAIKTLQSSLMPGYQNEIPSAPIVSDDIETNQ